MIVEVRPVRKARGAFFTPPEVSDFLARWAIRSSQDRVLEPSCGEASFLLAAGRRLKELTGTPDVRALVGVELHADSARAAVELMADEGMDVEIEVGDFFATDLAGHFDTVIGNPP